VASGKVPAGRKNNNKKKCLLKKNAINVGARGGLCGGSSSNKKINASTTPGGWHTTKPKLHRKNQVDEQKQTNSFQMMFCHRISFSYMMLLWIV